MPLDRPSPTPCSPADVPTGPCLTPTTPVRRQAKYDQAVVGLRELQEANAGLQQQCSQVRGYA